MRRGLLLAAAVGLLAACGKGAEPSRAGELTVGLFEAGNDAGALLLTSGIAACGRLLDRLAAPPATERMTLGSLGLRNSARRRGRSRIGRSAAGPIPSRQ